MYTIFLDLSEAGANKLMTNLSLASGGKWFVTHSSSLSTEIIGNFQALSQSDDGNTSEKTNQVSTPFPTLMSLSFLQNILLIAKLRYMKS